MALLYDQYGREIAARKKDPDRAPLPVAPMMDSFRDYVTDGLTPERLASVFKEADGGNVRRQAELFEQLEEKDLHLLCERDKRRNIILDLEFRVEPASEDGRDVKVAEFVDEFFADMADWDDCLISLQDAVGKGYAALETYWDVSSGQAMPEKFEFIEQQRFTWLGTDGTLRKTPLLLSDQYPNGGEIPAWKTVFHEYGGKSGNPMRSAIYRVAAWMVLFKHYTIKDWVIFCEVFGMPLRLGKYSPGATEDDKRALVAAITSLGTDAAGIISDSTVIEFIETVRTASSDLYQTMARFCNAEISKGVLGQTLSAEIGERGSYAAGKVHDGIRLDLLQADGRALAATVRNQIVRPLVGFNFGWDAALPKYRAVFNEEEDLGKKAEWFDKLTAKVQVPASWAREQFGVPEPDDGGDLVGGHQKKIFKYHLDYGLLTINEIRESLGLGPIAGGDKIPEPVFDTGADDQAAKLVAAKNDPAPAVDMLVERSASRPDLDPAIDTIKEMLAASTSLEEFRGRLEKAADGLPLAEFARTMQRALVLAELSGRFDQSQEG